MRLPRSVGRAGRLLPRPGNPNARKNCGVATGGEFHRRFLAGQPRQVDGAMDAELVERRFFATSC